MEAKDLPNTILYLVVIGIIIGTGVLVLGNFQNAARANSAVYNQELLCNFGVPCTVTGAPINPNLAFTVRNKSVTVPASAYTLNYDTGVMNLTTASYNQSGDIPFNLTYTSLVASSASTGVGNVVTALGTIPQTWLPLIVTIMALSIILLMVIRSFNMGNTRR